MISCLINNHGRQLTLFESFHKRNCGTSIIIETSDDSENEEGSDHDMYGVPFVSEFNFLNVII